MNTEFLEYFQTRWNRYFPHAELPIAYSYTDHKPAEGGTAPADRCLIGCLNPVRAGATFVYHRQTPGCSGGKRYTGFSGNLRGKFEYFLSCGIPGEIEGERYKQTPELVTDYLRAHPPFKAPGQYLVFKRWDRLTAAEDPFAVIFFATADVLSGLFTLANYDRPDLNAVAAPMGSGCASIVSHPYEQAQSPAPQCILGMFDVSARLHAAANELTFTVPMMRFQQMVRNMDESFLTTGAWEKVRERLGD